MFAYEPAAKLGVRVSCAWCAIGPLWRELPFHQKSGNTPPNELWWEERF
jgi:hypothetical protein